MAQIIWVEILSRGGQVVARHRCAGPELRIGRSYHSDVIIDDPTVAPDHLRVTQGTDGAIVVESISDAPPFLIKGDRHERCLVDGDMELRIGHTSLRLRDETYAVPAATVVVEPKPRWIALAALIVVTLMLNGLTIWLNETSEPKFSRDMAAVVMIISGIVIWAGFWALISRTFAGASRFPRHLVIGIGAFLAYTIYALLAQEVAFSLSSATIEGNLDIGLWVVLGVACFLHLHTITPSRTSLKAAIIAVLVIAGILVQVISQLEQLKNGRQPNIARTNFPPAFRLAHAKSEDQFFAAVDALQNELDADRETP
ncbi:MAG TPA: FHA domain-containing protein [Stellaceae bacterium]|jgi:hypothetical protein|nr:FHA domain-containing protein [Stellaceae bacterium]